MVREIIPGIYHVGVQDWDRRLFDELIPLPDGTSYNAYLVRGEEKTALIDTVDPTKKDELLDNLAEIGVEHLDYIISNHAEQDHSGAIPDVLEAYPGAKVVTNPKCMGFLRDLLHIPEERFIAVNDGDVLSLGGKTLEFIITPWVHWPETMLTYLREDGVLFTCDLFGSHFASSDIFVRDRCAVGIAAKRYYAEIMMPFRGLIRKHMERVSGLDVNVIAPSHGPVHDEPDFIMNLYSEWVSDNVRDEAVIAYVSMHGSTKSMVRHLSGRLAESGVSVQEFNLAVTDLGDLAMALVDAATVIVATPTVLTGPHPAVVYAAYLMNALRPKTRFIGVVASYGWGGRAVETLKGLLTNLRAEYLPPVVVRGHPRDDDFRNLDALAEEIIEKHKEVFGK